jgi:uncharacterized membrane protein
VLPVPEPPATIVRDAVGVSISVALEDVVEVASGRGVDAYLISVREDRPHVVAVQVAWRDGLAVVASGRRTAMNVDDQPRVTLLWPVTDAHPKHSLLVDGAARRSADGEWLEIEPTSAVLHRAGGRRRRLADTSDA